MKTEHVVRGSITSEHIVELFDTQDALTSALSTFLLDGFQKDDTLLVVAKSRNWKATAQSLEQSGCALDTAIRNGRLTVFDAVETMSQFMRRGRPDPKLFDAVVGALVRKLTAATGKRLRVYGEMVDVLAEERNFTAAQELEELWNGLALQCSFTLLCGYSAAHFTHPETRSALNDICHLHTRIRPSAADTLSGWVLSAAGSREQSDAAKAALWPVAPAGAES